MRRCGLWIACADSLSLSLTHTHTAVDRHPRWSEFSMLQSSIRVLHAAFRAFPLPSESTLADPRVPSHVPFLWPNALEAPQRIAVRPAAGLHVLSFMGRARISELLAEIRGLGRLRLQEIRTARSLQVGFSAPSVPVASSPASSALSGQSMPVDRDQSMTPTGAAIPAFSFVDASAPLDVPTVVAIAAAATASTAGDLPDAQGTAATAASNASMSIDRGEAQFAKLLVYGTPGWGKSHMLAAAAAVLRSDFFEGRSVVRLVYLPDCGQLRQDPLSYMQKALLLAFADDEPMMADILRCDSVDRLVQLLKVLSWQDRLLLFLADQTNKITSKQGGDVEKEKGKAAARRIFDSVSGQHLLVEAISINDSNKEEVAQKQENRKEMPMFGGLLEVSPHTLESSAILRA